MSKLYNRKILKKTTILIFFAFVFAALFCSCESFFNKKNTDSTPLVEEDDYICTVSGYVATFGAIPESRSATYSPTGAITDVNFTATHTDGTQIIPTLNTANKSFVLKLNKTGTWTISVSFKLDGNDYSGGKKITLTPEIPALNNIRINVFPVSIGTASSGTGSISLVTEYTQSLFIPPVAATMVLKNYNSSGTMTGTPTTINGSVSNTAKTVTFTTPDTSPVSSGMYLAEMTFYADSDKKMILYQCVESLLVATGKTTNQWVISSGELNAGPLAETDSGTRFIITPELASPFLSKSCGYSFYVGGTGAADTNFGTIEKPLATVQEAVNRILQINDKSSQYTIYLKADVIENAGTASYGNERNCSFVNIVGTETSADQTNIKIMSEPAALTASGKTSFAIDANRSSTNTGAVIWAEKVLLDLENVTVRGGYNASVDNSYNPCAAGLFLKDAAQVTIAKNTCIENNTQVHGSYNKQTGAGVGIWENCKFIMQGGVIRNNVNLLDYQSCGGVLVYKDAEFIMNPLKDEEGNEITCAIYGNRGMAGAIIVYSSGVFTMNGGVIGKPSSEVGQAADASHWGNKAEKLTSAGGKGGAIFLMPTATLAPTVHLNGGEICYNYAEDIGGAICCRDLGSFSSIVELNGTNICYNSAGINSDDGKGGAIYSESAVINMYKGQIYGNRAGSAGGAFYLEATDGFDTASEKLELNIYGDRIANNLVMNGEPQSSTGMTARGGAIYLGNKAKCQINGGIIERNKTYASNSASTGSEGGAIFMNNLNDNFAVSLTINGGFINANECGAGNPSANKRGAAIFYSSMATTFTNNNSSSIAENNDVCDASNPSSTSSTKCIVTFDTTTNYPGNTTKISPQIVQYEGKATAPSLSDGNPAPAVTSPETKHGNFLGWYTNPKPALNTESAFNFSTTQIYSNLTLYAVWDFVYVPGATFEGNSTLCSGVTNKESAIFIQDRVLPIGNLWVCDHEVTQGEYATYMEFNTDTLDPSGNNFPAYRVTWYDAVIYCNLRSEAEGLTPVYYLANSSGNEVANGRQISTWMAAESKIIKNANKYHYNPTAESTKLDYEGAVDTDGGILFDQNANGYRLPTEAEWEYIAREGNLSDSGQTLYSGSDTIDDVAWYLGNTSSKSKTVKTKQANHLGIYDMSGNLREWCWDWYQSPLSADIPSTGPLSSDTKVFRGGSCEVSAPYHTNNDRGSNVTNYIALNIVGFRVVRNAEGPAPATPVKHTVTFDTTTNCSGISLSIEPVQVYDGKKVSRPSGSPADNSVNFRGWFTKPNPSPSDTAFNFSTTTINRDITLYAVYDFVYVEGFTFDGAETLCAGDTDKVSNIFIEDRVLPIDNLWVCDHEVTHGEYETYCKYGGEGSYRPDSTYDADKPACYINWYDALVYCNLRSRAEGLTPVYKIKKNGGANNELTDNPAEWVNVQSEGSGDSLKYSGPPYESNNTYWNKVVCDWNANGYRLPTEAEWEYAARGGNRLPESEQYKYSGSDIVNNVGWVKNYPDPMKVKTKYANGLGLFDMSGNVYEWCWDWYSNITAQTDSYGAPSGTYRTVRGGSSYIDPVTVSHRYDKASPYNRNNNYGFRVVRNAQ